MIRNVYMGRLEEVVLQMELFTQIYNYFEDVEQLEYDNVYETVYSYEKDNTEIFTDLMIEDRINPDNKFAVDIVMNSDLNDLRYLYKYGEHVGFNELKMAKFLNSLSQEEIDRLAKVYTEGYRIDYDKQWKRIKNKLRSFLVDRLHEKTTRNGLEATMSFLNDWNPEKSYVKNLSYFKVDECNRHRKEMLEKGYSIPCFACRYYNRSMHILMEYFFGEKLNLETKCEMSTMFTSGNWE
jgi:hypothetical protein